jgi:hypothetical protein
MNMLSRDGSLRTVDRVMGAAKRNPEGVLLLAAGCALLMRGIGAATHALRDQENGASPKRAAASGRRRAADMAEEVEEGAHGFVDTAREYVSDLAGRVTHSAEAAVHYAGDARRTAFEQTGRVARQTRSGASDAMDRMMNEQPLTVALLGLAAGALLAGALPGTRLERRALAPVGERLGETADEARRRLKRSASRARERVDELAEERGLTRNGLRQAAREVAGAFSDELIGDDEGEARPKKARATARPRTKAGPKSAKAKAPAAAAVPTAQSATETPRQGANGSGNSEQDTNRKNGETDRSS